MGQKRRWLILGAALVLVGVAVAAYAHFHRFDGGPLDALGAAGGVAPVGEPRSYPLLLTNGRGGSVKIERVTPIYVAPGTRLRIWAVARGNAGQLVGGPFPPKDAKPGDLRSPIGFTVPKDDRRESHDLIAEIERTAAVPSGACAGFRGLALDYRAGSRRYRRRADVVAWIRPSAAVTCPPPLDRP